MAIVAHKDTFRRATSLFPFVDWTNAKILDWGGNDGNLLRASDGLIDPSNYTCLDVGLDSIEEGRREFPDATWIHWNRWSPWIPLNPRILWILRNLWNFCMP